MMITQAPHKRSASPQCPEVPKTPNPPPGPACITDLNTRLHIHKTRVSNLRRTHTQCGWPCPDSLARTINQCGRSSIAGGRRIQSSSVHPPDSRPLLPSFFRVHWSFSTSVLLLRHLHSHSIKRLWYLVSRILLSNGLN